MRCALCGEAVWLAGLQALLDHLRIMHPDRYDELEFWPDGGLVIQEDMGDLTVAEILGEVE